MHSLRVRSPSKQPLGSTRRSTTARALKEPKPAIDIVSAMNDPALFADWFQGESWDGWRAVLKAAYALAELGPAALRRSANKRSSDDIS